MAPTCICERTREQWLRSTPATEVAGPRAAAVPARAVPAATAAADEVAVGPGTLLGEMALFTETRRPATATALEPSTVLRIPRALFIKMLDSFPEAASKLRELFATRLDQSAREIATVRAALDRHGRKSE